MCGRGRFAILAAYEVDQYAQQRPRSRRGVRRNNENKQSSDHDPFDNPQDPVTDTATHYSITQNLSPGMECPVVFKSGEGLDSKFMVESMVWGIIPTYLTNPSANDHYRMFNKRIESLERSEIAPYFKSVIQAKRCVVIMDGFYEWKVIAGKKHPHYVSLGEDEPMKMAGIYEESNIFDPKIYATRFTKSFSIITGDPCAKFAPLHNRMPLLLTDDQVTQWLECPPDHVFSLMNELKANCSNSKLSMNNNINFFPVTPKVTAASYQEADCSTYKSIGQTLSSFFKTPYSPPVKKNSVSSMSDSVSETPTQVDEDICASIGADISAAESKEGDGDTTDTALLFKSELGKRTVPSYTEQASLPPSHRSPAKRSLFTTLLGDDDPRDDTSSAEFVLSRQTGRDSGSAINLTFSPEQSHTNSINTSKTTSNTTSTPTKTKPAPNTTSNTTSKSKPAGKGSTATISKTKKAASPGTKPITSFFARSPSK